MRASNTSMLLTFLAIAVPQAVLTAAVLKGDKGLCHPTTLHNLTMDDGSTLAVIMGEPFKLTKHQIGSKVNYSGSDGNVKFRTSVNLKSKTVDSHLSGYTDHAGVGYMYETITNPLMETIEKPKHGYFTARQDGSSCQLPFNKGDYPDSIIVHKIMWRD